MLVIRIQIVKTEDFNFIIDILFMYVKLTEITSENSK